MKRFLALFLTFSIVFTLLSVTASAEVVKAKRITIKAPKSTVAVGKSMYLDFTVSPSDADWDDVVWSTDYYDLVDLDEYGEITGLEPGTATIRVELYMKDPDTGKRVRIGSATKDIKVTGTSPSRGTAILPRDVDDDGNVVRTTNTKGAVSSTTVVDAVKKALVKGEVKSATFKDYDSVSAYAIQSADTAMKGGTVLLNFDTMSGSDIEGRMIIDPKNSSSLKNDINVGVYTNNVQTYKAVGAFKKYFKNDFMVVKAAHSGSYGISVKFAVKADKTIAKSKNLHLYSYNPADSKYKEITDSGIYVDANGYVRFASAVGDYLVISNGALVKK